MVLRFFFIFSAMAMSQFMNAYSFPSCGDGGCCGPIARGAGRPVRVPPPGRDIIASGSDWVRLSEIQIPIQGQANLYVHEIKFPARYAPEHEVTFHYGFQKGGSRILLMSKSLIGVPLRRLEHDQSQMQKSEEDFDWLSQDDKMAPPEHQLIGFYTIHAPNLW